MTNLKLITTETFGDLSCNFYRNMNDDILLTREQIGQALEYADPIDAIYRIHKRHSDRLDPLSTVKKIKCKNGKFYNSCLYTLEGALIICSLSHQDLLREYILILLISDCLFQPQEQRLLPYPRALSTEQPLNWFLY